jgi:hypothetical protein
VLSRRIPWCYAACGAVAYVVVGLWLADRLPTWSEEVSLQSNHGYRVLPDEIPAGDAGGPLPIPPWCGAGASGSAQWIVSSARPVLTLCVHGRAWPVLTMPYASGVFAWPMTLLQPLHHDDIFVQRKIGLVRGLLALAVLFVMVRRLCGGERGRVTAGLACLLAGASAPFVYPHVLLFPYETLPWTLVAGAFWLWSRCPELWPGAEPRAEKHASSRNRRLLGGAALAGLAVLSNVKAAFLIVPLVGLALRLGVSVRRISAPQWTAMAGIFAVACSPIWVFALVDPAAGLSHQLAWRVHTMAQKLRPEAAAAEIVNLCTFGSDLGFYFEQVSGKSGTHFRLGLAAVAIPIAYAWLACVTHVARRPVGSTLAATCGAILATYFGVSWLLYDQTPAANYSPLHCVFGATYAAFCTDAAAALAKLSRSSRTWPSERHAAVMLALPLALVLLWATLRRGDPTRTLTTSLSALAEREAARYLVEHRDRGELLTTSYNLAGVLDSLGQEALHPVQAHMFLARCTGPARSKSADPNENGVPARSKSADPNENEGPARSKRADPNENAVPADGATPSCIQARLRWILDHRSVEPLRVLVPALVTPVDWPAEVNRAVPDALQAAASTLGLSATVEARFHSGDGTEVLRLLRVDSGEAQLEAGAAVESAPAPGPAELIGLREGEALGPLVIEGFRPITDGCLPLAVRSGDGRGQLEVALRGGAAVPAASSERYAVYWDQSPSLTPEVLGQAAAALAERLRSTESKVQPPAGMRTFGSQAIPGR